MNRNDKEFMIRRIRTQYTAQTETSVDELRALDRRVRRPADIFGFVFGAVGALIAGTGMSLVMTDLGVTLGMTSATYPLGVVLGVAGLFMAAVTYPIYRKFLVARRAEYADRIFALSDQAMADMSNDAE